MAWADSTGLNTTNSTSRHEPYGGYRTKPVAAVNPGYSDRGFTGHRMNNTGSYDLGLIYMNARYYLPEIGRFVSADTIVPDPKTPQSHNRYAYALNSPTNLTDPTGHCSGSSDGIGNTFDENLCWASVATIGNLWDDTDYWQQQWGSYEDFLANVGSHPMLDTGFFSDELMRYMKSDEYKAWSANLPATPRNQPIDLGDYTAISATVIPTGLGFFGVKLIVDDYGNIYLNVHVSSMPTGSITRGDLYLGANSKPFDSITSIDDVPGYSREASMQQALTGVSGSASFSAFLLTGSTSVSGGHLAHITAEGGVSLPGYSLSADIAKTILVFDRGSRSPWYWQR